jgi:hypothetical protein
MEAGYRGFKTPYGKVFVMKKPTPFINTRAHSGKRINSK